jgi:mannose-P-dolichol utilization defect protein 1
MVLSLLQGRAGQLSVITTFLMFIGTVVRVFTSLRENSGPAMVRGFILGAAINGLMLFQILFYGKDGRLVQPQKPRPKPRAKKVQ